MSQAGCQIHPTFQPAHPTEFVRTNRRAPPAASASILALHSTLTGPRTGGVLRIRNIKGMITRNKAPITQNASAKASMLDYFSSLPYITPCACALAPLDYGPALC